MLTSVVEWCSGRSEKGGKNVTREADSNGELQSCSRNLKPGSLKKKSGYLHTVASGH